MGHELTGEERSGRSLRVNTLKISEKELIKKLRDLEADITKINFLRNGYYVNKSEFSLGASIEYLLGFFTLQEAAAQFPIEVLDPKEGETLLDMCAAPGGKTVQAADHMKNKGAIVSIDKKKDRLHALENNAERTGVKNCIAYCDDVLKMDLKECKFDKILLDAPCSGNYANDPAWFRKRDLEGIEKNAEVQKRMLERGVSLLKKGGVLVYSTCSLEPEENEKVISWGLKNLGIRLISIDEGSNGLTDIFGEKIEEEVSRCCRFWPDTEGTQGFFCAKIMIK